MIGDGYETPIHCQNVDLIGLGIEPDAAPRHCGDWNDNNDNLFDE